MSGWLVTTTSSQPASARRRQASAAPGRSVDVGDRGRRVRAAVAHRRPRSARRRGRGRRPGAAVGAHHRRPARASSSMARIDARSAPRRAVPVLPAQGPDAVGGDAHDGHVALPARSPPRVAQLDRRGVEAEALDGHPGDLGDGDVVAGGHVEDVEGLASRSRRPAARPTARRRRARRTCSGCRRRGSRGASGRRAACARSRSRRRGSGADRPRCRSGRPGPGRRTCGRRTTSSASPASLLAP